jgi:hypothetical protein
MRNFGHLFVILASLVLCLPGCPGEQEPVSLDLVGDLADLESGDGAPGADLDQRSGETARADLMDGMGADGDAGAPDGDAMGPDTPGVPFPDASDAVPWGDGGEVGEPDIAHTAVCGNGACEAGYPVENPAACPEDCGSCGDGVCGPKEESAEFFCVHDCATACGNGICEEGESALPGVPGYCPPDCGGCDDGCCGYQDLQDPDLADCKALDCSPGCGDEECAGDESWESCPVDCGWCGDGVCGEVWGEKEPCPQDCVKPCGDGICSGDETAESCPVDCGPCGDGVCGLKEMAEGCAADCPPQCGNGQCQFPEDEAACPYDCACLPLCEPGWECGPDGSTCGFQCGACPDGTACVDHTCCLPECAGKSCGPDGCGGSCGECDDGLLCTDDLCGPEGSCLAQLHPFYCLIDGECVLSGQVKPGNACLRCDVTADLLDWTVVDHGYPCGEGGICLAGSCCPAAANCAVKECGPNGCGGLCGLCPEGTGCVDGVCLAGECQQQCGGKECGDDGCGGQCGECFPGEVCANALCIPDQCTPQCDGLQCGPDGCGSTCGSCDDGTFCTSDLCLAGLCANKVLPGHCLVDGQCHFIGEVSPGEDCLVCDPAGTGGDSGWTPKAEGQICDLPEGGFFPFSVCHQGACCQRICDLKVCGDDGCGGVCGSGPADNLGCPDGLACADDGSACLECGDGNDEPWDGCNDGVPVEFRVNQWTASDQMEPCLALFDDGGFVVAWTSTGQDDPGDPAGKGVYARLFGPGGLPAGDEIPVNGDVVTNAQHSPAVAVLGDSSWVVVWAGWSPDSNGPTDANVHFRRFDREGQPLLGSTLAHAPTASSEKRPAIASLAGGGLVLAWTSPVGEVVNGFSNHVVYRIFDGNGAPTMPAPVELFANTGSLQRHAALCSYDDGSWLASWSDNGLDGDKYGVFARRFHGDGTPATPTESDQVRLNVHVQGSQWYGALGCSASTAGFIAAWEDRLTDAVAQGEDPAVAEEDPGVYLRLFEQQLTPTSAELRAGSHLPGEQRNAAVAAAPGGQAVVSWSGFGSGDEFGVWSQRYLFPGTVSSLAASVHAAAIDPALNQDGVPQFVPVSRVAMFPNGDYTVVWTNRVNGDEDVFARRFLADGTECKVGSCFQLGYEPGCSQSCADLNPCTLDGCDEETGECTHVPISAPCDDGDPCTTQDQCVDGACKGGQQLQCDDGNTCTEGLCEPGIGCVFEPAPGNLCSTACIELGQCTDIGTCAGPQTTDCDDSNPCTVDLCDHDAGCVYVELDGGACDDGDSCTEFDTCQAGTCVGISTECENCNPCVVNQCVNGVGCTSVETAEDGTPCHGGGLCMAGICEILPVPCVDPGPDLWDGCKDGAVSDLQVAPSAFMSLPTMPSLSPLPGGGLLLLWEENLDVKGRILGADGLFATDPFVVNATTQGQQSAAQAAAFDDGSFVVVWMGDCGFDANGVCYRHFDAAGQALAQEDGLISNIYPGLVQGNPQVVAYEEGQFPGRRFVVFWESDTDSLGNEIYARQIKLDEGLPGVDEWTHLHAPSDGEDVGPAVARLPGGKVVYAFQGSGQILIPGAGYEILYNVIGPDGAKVMASAQMANTAFDGDQQAPTVAQLPGTGFAIAWESAASEGKPEGLFARVFDGDGEPLTDEFQVNCENTFYQFDPVAAGLSDGGFVVAWEDRRVGADESLHSDVAFRMFNAAGAPVTFDLTANGFLESDQARPAVTGSGSGFAVVWNGYQQTGSNAHGVYLQRFDSKGAKLVP